MTYIPTPGPLPGQQFTPSNSGEGCLILEDYCTLCARDRAMREGMDVADCDDDELCEIIAAAFRGQAAEWRELDTGELVCIAYVEMGEPVPAARYAYTIDLFETKESQT